MKFVLDQCFKDANRDVDKYLKFKRLSPMYRLQFTPDKYMDCHDVSEKHKMIKELERVFPEDVKGYDEFIGNFFMLFY